MRQPPPLSPGARVAIVSPAGPLRDEAELARAVDNARSFGWEPVVGEHALVRHGYFAGETSQRLADFNRALGDDTIDAVWCARGGYGAMYLLPGLDYDALVRHPKPVIGYSDITAIHCAIRARTNLVTIHGPTARAVLTPFTRASFERAVMRSDDPCGAAPAARVVHDGRAHGPLAGGNLALLAALAGTPWAPRLDGAILVLEDINEPIYRIDRMLMQLWLGGSLARVAGIVFGQCTSCPEDADDGARTLDDVLAQFARWLDVPCISGAPFGHIDDQWTLPLGALAHLDTAARTLQVNVHDE